MVILMSVARDHPVTSGNYPLQVLLGQATNTIYLTYTLATMFCSAAFRLRERAFVMQSSLSSSAGFFLLSNKVTKPTASRQSNAMLARSPDAAIVYANVCDY
jgi:hypothetical protein